MHDLDHEQIDGLVRLLDAEHGVCHNVGELVCHLAVDLRGKGCSRNAQEQLAVDFLHDLELIKKVDSEVSGGFVALGDKLRVQSLTDKSFRLSEKLSSQKDIRRRTISNDIVLCSRAPSNHRSGWVLDLHLAKQNIPVLG
jgi:hypothetical protein